MQQVDFGRTGLKVSAACLGAGGHSRLGQTYGATAEQSIAVVKAAYDLGITVFDTAAKYGTEPIVGAGLKGVRDKVLISTKTVMVHKDEREGFGSDELTGDELIADVEERLRRLSTDYIDILHLHGVGARQYQYVLDELVPAFIKLREAGKVRFFGVTERFNIDTKHEMLKRAARDRIWDVVMVGYNFLNQTAAAEVLPLTRENGIATLCMYAVRGGLADHERAKRLIDDLIARGEIDPDTFDRDDPLGFLREDGRAIPIAEAAYRFCRHTPGIDIVMTGTGKVEHLRENVRSIEAPPLPAEVEERLRRIFRNVSSQSGNPLA